MSETQELLRRIAALRQRLDQAQGPGPRNMAPNRVKEQVAEAVEVLESKVLAGSCAGALLETALPAAADPVGEEKPALPPKLTARSAWLLQRGREHLHVLRALADDPLLPDEGDDPLAALHRQTAALIDNVLRTIQAMPDSPSAQVRLCDGLEVVVAIIGEQLGVLTAALSERRRETARLDTLTDLLTALAEGRGVELRDFQPLAEELVEDARQGTALRFCHAPADGAARFVAAHSLTVAQVLARAVLADPEWAPRLYEPVLAALLHDVGMLQVPAALLNQSGALDDEQRRSIERHPLIGADLVGRIAPAGSYFVEAAGAHHERSDGTGYPAGLRELQVAPLVRLLAACDVYAALCCPRPYRPALDTRTALTDTLLLADRGALDRFQAERLLRLSFYPVGSVVQLADASIGVVVATNPDRRDVIDPARPVVALLTDAQRQPLAVPRHVNLVGRDGPGILRSLPSSERRKLLGRRYPVLV